MLTLAESWAMDESIWIPCIAIGGDQFRMAFSGSRCGCWNAAFDVMERSADGGDTMGAN